MAGSLSEGECGDAYPRRWRHAETVRLESRARAPGFYARREHFVTLFAPEDVISNFEQTLTDQSGSEDRAFLEAINSLLPLKVSIDLYSFAVDHKVHLSQIDFLVARLLERGEARLVDLWSTRETSDPTLGSIAKVTISHKNAPAKLREFCAPNGELLLSIVDGIKD